MELYNVKQFKPRLMVLAGPTTAVEAAKKAGLKTHPTMRVFDDQVLPVADPADNLPDPTIKEKIREKLPPREPELNDHNNKRK